MPLVVDEVVETPYAVCKTAVLAVELIDIKWLSEKESNLRDRGISTT